MSRDEATDRRIFDIFLEDIGAIEIGLLVPLVDVNSVHLVALRE
jgi:hypothetical protein